MKIKEKILLAAILILALFLRVYDINWDQNSHLHPDERFLTMVGVAMKPPVSIPDYFNPSTSTFNPANIGFDFYVYGIFPVTLNKIIALTLGNDNYHDFTIQGRFISALSDFAVVIAIFWVLLIMEKKYKLSPNIKFFAALIYAIAVLPIQLSHFFAVDTFLNTFAFLSFCFAVSYWINKKKISLILSAVFFGLSVASKATAIYELPIILFLFLDQGKNLKKFLIKSLTNFIIFGLCTFFVLKISDPYLFASGFIFDVRPNQLFLNSLKILDNLSSKNSTFPPAVQWIHKTPILFPLQNIILLGFGIIHFFLLFPGLYQIVKKNIKPIIFTSVWVLFFFVYQGTRNTTTMRYFVLIYPFLAILAGFGFELLREKSKIFFYTTFVLLFIWPLMFFSIYTKSQSRVAATFWINRNIPAGKMILTEHWDDALPLGSSSNYKIIELPVFDPDTFDKWKKMDELLAKGDYIILSSNRGWGSIPTVPERYPKMSKFYKDLFANKTDYKKIKEVTSYPSLSYLGIPLTISDDGSEESFTVYDHPKVMIFKKEKNL